MLITREMLIKRLAEESGYYQKDILDKVYKYLCKHHRYRVRIVGNSCNELSDGHFIKL